jgi:hypothetical protein
MDQILDQYYWHHFLATMGVLLCIIMYYYYPIVLFVSGIGVLGYFYVKSQEPIVERFYQSFVDNTPTRSPSQESQK